METVHVTLTGTTPLLYHADNIEWADRMSEWGSDPDNKRKSKAGDDRTPPWRWYGCLNFDDAKSGVITMPAEYIMASIKGGATKMPTGRGKGTFKAESQSGLVCSDFHWPLLVNGKPIKMADVNECLSLKTFKEQLELAEMLGFSLFMKRVKVNQSKHIRVRPRFDNWSVTGEIVITSDEITVDILRRILQIAGKAKGVGDWRPGAPQSPGSFGMFEVQVVNGK